jgi:hypothetical protein
MRSALVFTFVLAFCGGVAVAADRWAERPYFARRPGQQVPPPQFYATTDELPAGTEIRIKVVKCPDKAGVALHHFIGGPVFSIGVVKDFSDLKADQVLTCKLDDKMKIGIKTSIGDDAATCKGLEKKDDGAVMTFTCGDAKLVIQVEIVGK